MNLCIDLGNSSAKIGIFDGDILMHSFSVQALSNEDIEEILGKWKINASIISSVRNDNAALTLNLKKRLQSVIELTHGTPVPIENSYSTPETLGKDRLAAVVGASFLKPDTNLLVIDAGTAITYDFIDSEKKYHGGNIAPGLEMRLRALHEFTQKLPLVEPISETPELGYDTETALASGAIYGIVFEIDGYIGSLKNKYPGLSTYLTGGSTFYFYNKLKNAIFAEKNLVLIGLNRILKYNV